MLIRRRAMTENNQEHIVSILAERFDANMHRHEGMEWEVIRERITHDPKHLLALRAMEDTGGEPDVIGYDETSDTYTFVDCCKESPKGRRSACYDKQALESRKKFPPKHNAMDTAAEIGITILTEEEYRALQQVEVVDTKTSSWIHTCRYSRTGRGTVADYRYGHVFIYHNGAESYYGARGFRGKLNV
ncbi:LOW QUALITY PROTEIN: hypothetical protein JCM19039_3349 [Geomicrobium sp. JCM 19039]|nr:LOW QUALITY PROTEIN: hypothetical protein JCM19039_3349 [Geomicrobium sp. JCM 19039]